MQRHSLFLTAAGAICITFLLLVFTTRSIDLGVNSLEKRKTLYQSPASTTNLYEAPLLHCDNPNQRVPDRYCVFLNVDYTLEQHKQAVADHVDLDAAVRNLFAETERRGLYYCADLQDSGLAAVRADIGVDMVECDAYIYLID